MSDTKINIEVVCEKHPTEKLEVVTEAGSNFYSFRLRVSPCNECLEGSTEGMVAPEDVTKTAELIFNDSNFTSQTIEV